MEGTFAASKGRDLEKYRYQEYRAGWNRKHTALVFNANLVDTLEKVATYMPPRLPYDKYNINGANSFFFIEWFDWAEAHRLTSNNPPQERYSPETLLLLELEH